MRHETNLVVLIDVLWTQSKRIKDLENRAQIPEQEKEK